MDNRTAEGLRILGAAVVVGVAGDALLRGTPWGINVLLLVGIFVMALAALMRSRRLFSGLDGRSLLGVALFFAAGFAWRDSGTLRFLNGLALVVSFALALAALRAWPGQLRIAALTDYALTVGYAGVHAAGGAIPLVFREIGWRRLPGGRWFGPAVAALRGVFIALPILILFGGLFMAADAVFAEVVIEAFDWDAGDILDHLVLVGFFSWVTAGLLRGVVGEMEPATAAIRRPVSKGLGFVDLATALALVDALFLAFLLFQLRYLFGGATYVSQDTGFTYAEYARRGFFELVAVSTLSLPLLLLAHSLVRTRNTVQERVFGVLSGAWVVMLFVVMTSAFQRMRLYQVVYGMTELRLYTTAFMMWLALLLIWFLATVLRGRRQQFAFGLLVSGLASIALLNAVNPDDAIVRINARQAVTGLAADSQVFDVPYLVSLSADAVPTLVEIIPALDETQRRDLARGLLRRWNGATSNDWRTFAWGRYRAVAVLNDNREMLVERAGPLDVPPPRTRKASAALISAGLGG